MNKNLVVALGLASVLALAACKKKEEAPADATMSAPSADTMAPAPADTMAAPAMADKPKCPTEADPNAPCPEAAPAEAPKP